ncbi:MAG TPA: AAC(3) family N-acetyltransferase [Lentimicrobium sp.]|nr:AAC(3) family N-acetyltransferase [Lentimicrobium sp.]
MLTGKILLKLVPFSVYHKLRSLYRNVNKLIHQPLTEAEFAQFLKERLQVQEGDTVFIHSSIDKLNITFTPHKLLDLLLQAVGPEGTLLFPAWHFNYRAEDYLKKGLVFDVRRSPSALGMLSEVARRHPAARRSLHPTSSVTAIGPKAGYLTAEHHLSVYPCGDKSPFYKMMELDAKIIGLGVSTEFLSFVHSPEDIMKSEFPYPVRNAEVSKAKVRDYNGNITEVKTLSANKAIGKRDIPGFIKAHISQSVAEDFRYRGNDFFRVNAKKLFVKIRDLAMEGVTIYEK